MTTFSRLKGWRAPTVGRMSRVRTFEDPACPAPRGSPDRWERIYERLPAPTTLALHPYSAQNGLLERHPLQRERCLSPRREAGDGPPLAARRAPGGWL